MNRSWSLGVVALLAAGVASASTISVCPAGCAHSTIQGAINSAASGDVINIAPGLYNENISISGKSLTLRGPKVSTGQLTSNPQAEIRGNGAGPVVVLGSGSDSDNDSITIAYVTVTHGSHVRGTGIGGGIQVRQGAALSLMGSVVTNNLANFGGGVGISSSTATSYISESTISGNLANGPGGGVYLAAGSSVNLDGVAVTTNTAGGMGGGIYASAGSDLGVNRTDVGHNEVIKLCTLPNTNCKATGGGVATEGSITMSNSAIANNASQLQGGGLSMAVDGSQTIFSTAISGNTAAVDGGGIMTTVGPAGSPTIWYLTDVYVVNNYAYAGAAGGVFNAGHLQLDSTTIAGNSPSDCKGGTGCP